MSQRQSVAEVCCGGADTDAATVATPKYSSRKQCSSRLREIEWHICSACLCRILTCINVVAVHDSIASTFKLSDKQIGR